MSRTTSFEVIDTSAWTVERIEQMGKKRKAWLIHPNARVDESGEPLDPGDRWLFKQVRSDHQGARGEDWAEKAVAEIAPLLGIPSAHVELASHPWQEGPSTGAISRSILSRGDRLEHGNELLEATVPGYDPAKEGEVSGYTVQACMDVLAPHGPTPGFSTPPGSGVVFEFAGYLILDALVNNTDRHHENWAVVRQPDGTVHLAPSFDHASSLGFTEPRSRKQRLLDQGTIEEWLARGKTKFEGQPSPFDVAVEALAMLSHTERQEWRHRIESVHLDLVSLTLNRIPDPPMSQVDRNFALETVRINQKRLVDVL